ncbi:MAG: hypothetical protein M3Y42_07525 [Actinomycetota bacterium]|nr:hypothetical protein [Actinomycetota bacterium]MDQ2956798.1 hypothetical protein [Actinomycetota bacterium]
MSISLIRHSRTQLASVATFGLLAVGAITMSSLAHESHTATPAAAPVQAHTYAAPAGVFGWD